MILSTKHVKELQKKAKDTFIEVFVRFNYRPYQPVVTTPAQYKIRFDKKVLIAQERTFDLLSCVLGEFDSDIRELDFNLDFIPKAMLLKELNSKLHNHRENYIQYNKSSEKWRACYERCRGEGKKILIEFIKDNSQ